MYCQRGKADCLIYRLARPCPFGRCLVPPDKSLVSSVFSDAPQLIGDSR